MTNTSTTGVGRTTEVPTAIGQGGGQRDGRANAAHGDAIRPAPHAACDVCGGASDASFEVLESGYTHTFDTFECAVHALSCDRAARPVQSY
jgi:hypothetical protein